MSGSHRELVQGRTRWRRFAVVMVPAVVAVGGIVFGMANGAIAASFSVSGQQFKVSATELHGTGFKQYSGVDVIAKGGAVPVAVSEITDATLTNLCQSVAIDGGPFGKIVLRIEAGGNGTDATAHDLVIGMSQLQGDATFSNIQIGRDGGQLKGTGADGSFGQSADSVVITDLQQVATSTSAGTFALNGLNLRVLTGAAATNPGECF